MYPCGMWSATTTSSSYDHAYAQEDVAPIEPFLPPLDLWAMWEYLWCMHCEGCGFCLPQLSVRCMAESLPMSTRGFGRNGKWRPPCPLVLLKTRADLTSIL